MSASIRAGGPCRRRGISRVEVTHSVVRAALEGPGQSAPEAARSRRCHSGAHRLVTHIRASLSWGPKSGWFASANGAAGSGAIGLTCGELRAQCRFYPEALTGLRLYVSPLNLDPPEPALPISTPDGQTPRHWRARPDPWTRKACPRTRRPSRPACSRSAVPRRGSRPTKRSGIRTRLLSSPIGCSTHASDEVTHMTAAAHGPAHPAYNAANGRTVSSSRRKPLHGQYAIRRRTLYGWARTILLVIMSDYGFASWRRTFNLNTWPRL